MNCVTWAAADEYCSWIGGRLPTADEWEYAATHDGTQSSEKQYPWGDEEPEHCKHASYNNYVSSSSNLVCDGTMPVAWSEAVGTSAVGTYSPKGDSPLGLQDLSGNVFEWTSSLYSDSSSDYIPKGGAWNTRQMALPVSARHSMMSARKLVEHGFRCIVDID